MKKIIHIVCLMMLCALMVPTVTFAQKAPAADKGTEDADYKAFVALRDDKNAKAGSARFQQVSKAGIDYIIAYPKSMNSAKVVSKMADFYTTMPTAKDAALRAQWYSQVQLDSVSRSSEATTKEAKTAFLALDAAILECEMREKATQETYRSWREKLDTLATAPNGNRYLKEREVAFYEIMAPRAPQIVDAQLAQLVDAKDKGTAEWAKGETKYRALRQQPVVLQMTTIDGKQLDTSKMKAKVIYLYFWSTSTKDVGKDISKVLDVYAENSRRDFEVIGICCDPEENRDAVLAFIKKNKMKFPQCFDGKGLSGELANQFAVTALPTGFFIDSKGALGKTNIKGSGAANVVKVMVK